MIRVGLIGDGTMILAGLQAIVSGDPEMEIVEAAENCDVLVCIGRLGIGASMIGEVPLPEPVPAVLVLTDDVPPYRSVLEKAPEGFGLLPTNTSAEELKAAIHALAAGLLAGAPGMMRSLLNGSGFGEEVLRDGEELSPREAEVLQLLFLGLLNKEIAARLEISEHTVKYHVSSILTKLGVANRVEAIRAGIRLGLLEL
jgi:DNA-binding NarL/FixJ family response regulator